jgi:tetratricopeptide (TPR) repeat protein
MRFSTTSSDARQLLGQAFQLHQAGRLAEAESIYRQVLRVAPADFAALHLLGAARLDQGDPAEAVKLFDKALAINPASAEAQANRGNALLRLGKVKDALASFDKALQGGGRYPEVISNRASALRELGRFDEALSGFDQALALNPRLPQALNNRAEVLRCLNRLSEALAACDAALAVVPDAVEVLVNRGAIFAEMKRFEDALANFDRALKVRPGLPLALSNRAATLRCLGRLEEGLADCDTALAANPALPEALVARANILRDMKCYPEALSEYDAALGTRPRFAEALSNRSGLLNILGRPQDALQSAEDALLYRPDLPEALNCKGVSLTNLARLEEAVACFDRAIALEPAYAEAHHNKGVALLYQEKLDEGFALFEWRKKLLRPIDLRKYPQPAWTGVEELKGKTLFLYSLHGLGDTLHFFRYAALAARRGGQVVLAAQEKLHRLLKMAAPEVELLGPDDTPSQFDYHNAITSTPWAFARGGEDVSATPPYLQAEPELVKHWAARIGAHGFKVGIAWQGTKVLDVDLGRSTPLHLFEPLARIPGVRLISLQKNDGVEQLDQLPNLPVERLGDELDNGEDAFVDTAAAMQALDLVITSDTALAHLAGALDRRVWVALKHVPDWRWFLRRTDSPWYPSMRLFRQSADGDWAAPFAEIEAALAEVASR